jgi:hypothetical protein
LGGERGFDAAAQRAIAAGERAAGVAHLIQQGVAIVLELLCALVAHVEDERDRAGQEGEGREA